MFKRIAAVAALSALGVSAADAQQPGMHGHMSDSLPSMEKGQEMMMGGMMGQGMMGAGMMQMMGQGMGMMATGGPGPAMLLRMRDDLDLTGDQVSRIEEILGELRAGVEPQMSTAMSAHNAAKAALEADPADFDAYEQSLEAAANVMVQLHVAMARAQVETREVLTPEQRENLSERRMKMMPGMMHR